MFRGFRIRLADLWQPDVMQLAHHYFENGISYFPRAASTCISFGCANGEVALFVAHTTFLRWSTIQDTVFIDPDDGVTKIWSESNVSEGFDMALRLQVRQPCSRVRSFLIVL